jgi:aspartyl aminopeptidase
MKNTVSAKVVDLLNSSYSAFHAVENIKNQLTENGFVQLWEGEKWSLSKGGKYFVTKNDSSVIAFKVPQNEYVGFNIVASHSDSPTFKIKENAELEKSGFICLNTERYGGMIMSTWFDRPLSVAGRIIVKTENGFQLLPLTTPSVRNPSGATIAALRLTRCCRHCRNLGR